MVKFSTKGPFQWKHFEEFESNKNISNSSKSFILEVALEYPRKLDHLYNDYSLAPEKKKKKKKKTEVKKIIA